MHAESITAVPGFDYLPASVQTSMVADALRSQWAIRVDRIMSDLDRNDLRGLHAAFMIDCES